MRTCFLLPVGGWTTRGTTRGQQQTALTVEQAVTIVLYESYAVQSSDEDRRAMQDEYLYYKAPFEPGLKQITNNRKPNSKDYVTSN
ncbi:MAG: hypothetical protein LBB90_05730 [Tannerella sp.]|jgi:hypothetical protein|nr:hypothetical protein [Tannerella sp.]